MARTLLTVALWLTFYFGFSENISTVEEQSATSNAVGTQAAKQEPIGNQAITFFSSLTSTGDWPTRWQCGTWSDFHAWLHILSDLVIWLSYFMIPLTLAYFMYKKRAESIPFRSVLLLFIVFILGCGLTHLTDAAMFWWPAYRVNAFIRLITAVVSFGTVFALVRIAPRVAALRTPDALEKMVEDRTHELQALNITLQGEIRQRERVEEKLKKLNAELEERSASLEEINKQLLIRERDLRKNEEKVKQLNYDLEKAVEERTAQLNNSNNELEAFTYSVSHDLRAPLRAIDGYARILEEDYNERIDAQGKRLIHIITKNARYMGQLIDDLLEFSRTSRVEVVKTWFHTDEEVRSICSDLMVHEKNRKLEIQILPMESCKGDINMLRQVWINLVSNAMKYTRKKDEARIEIGCVVREDEIEYYVKDNGVGFDMEYIDKLFGVFQRLHSQEEFEGTGVGLAMVHRIIARHKGRIWAEGRVNEGATFFFTLTN